MANTPTTDLTSLYTDSTTGWSELASYSNGAAPSLEEEAYLQGNNAVSQAIAANKTGAASGLDYSATSPAGFVDIDAGFGRDVFLFWWLFFFPSALNDYNETTGQTAPTQNTPGTASGFFIGIGSSTTNHDWYAVGGADYGRYPYGGWQNVAIDPQVTPSFTDGPPAQTTYTNFGFLPNVISAPSRGQSLVVDAIRWGRGLIQYTGGAPAGTFDDIADTNDTVANRWGLFQRATGGFLFKGRLELGTAASSLLFTDSNKNIFIDDTRQVYGGFNEIIISNASSDVSWTNISITKLKYLDALAFDNSKGNITSVSAPFTCTDCTFTDMNTFLFGANTTVSGTVFRRCSTVTQNGASITSCTFANTDSGATGSLASTSTTLGSVTGCSFVRTSGTVNAVRISDIINTDTEVTWDGNVLTGYGTGVTGTGISSTAGGAIEVVTNAVLTISVVNGATIPTVEFTGTGSVNVVAAVEVTISGLLGNTEVSVLENPSPYSSSVAAPVTRFDEDVLSAVTGTDIELDTGGGANITQILRTGTTDFTTMGLVNGDKVRVSQRSNLKIFDTYTVVGTPTASAITVTPVASSTSKLPAIIDSPGETVTVEKVDASYTFPASSGEVVDILAFRVGSLPIYQLNQTISSTNNSFPLSQVVDRNFDAFEV